MNRALSVIGGFGAGIAVGYLIDPARGRRRRKLAGDQVVHAAHVGGDAIDTARRDMRGRGQGLVSNLRARFQKEQVDDAVLMERVRTAIGRAVTHPSAIEVSAAQGMVTLSGPVLADEADRLLARVAAVRGVTGVEQRLEIHSEAGDVPGLQGTAVRRSRRADLMQEYWSPTTRVVTGIAGGGLALFGLARRGVPGTLLGLAGLGLGARAATNLSFRRLTGVGAGRRAIDFHKTITVDAPVDQVYRFWANFENFPRFMGHVREIQVSPDSSTSRWTVAGPAGVPLGFDAELTKAVHNECLAWKTRPGSAIQHDGLVRFEPARGGGTRLDIRMSYNPVAGAVGHTVAALFGADPKRAMDEDMVRFKSLIEEGKTTVHGDEVTRSDLNSGATGQITEMPRAAR